MTGVQNSICLAKRSELEAILYGIVSNKNGSDTKCKELTFEVVNTSNTSGNKEAVVNIFPNPFQ